MEENTKTAEQLIDENKKNLAAHNTRIAETKEDLANMEAQLTALQDSRNRIVGALGALNLLGE